jgi:hypothetical protein
VLDAGKSPVLTAENEDAGAPVGTPVSALVDFASTPGGLDNVTDADANAQLGIAVTGADTTHGSWFYSTDGGANWNALGAVSDAAARLLAADATDRLYFQPNADFNGTIAAAITFRAWDQTSSGGDGDAAPAVPSGGTTAFSNTTDTASLTILPVNDAPVLDAGKSPALTAENEDMPTPTGAVGTPVSALVDFASAPGGLDNVSDADAGAQLGIAVTGADVSHGSWFYSTNGASWTPLGAVSNTSALLLTADPTDRLYFQPNTDFNGSIAAAITFRAWDRTSGSIGAFADTTTSGGTTAFSNTTDTASLTINPVNDAPVLDPGKSPVLTAENEDDGAPFGPVGTRVLALVDFASPAGQVDNVTDVDTHALLGIAVIGADTTHGSWFYSSDDGTHWSALGAVSDSAARLLAANATDRLYFQPNADFNGTISDAVTFRAWDQTSGTDGALASAATNGGTTAFSTATETASITINPAMVPASIVSHPSFANDFHLV